MDLNLNLIFGGVSCERGWVVCERKTFCIYCRFVKI